MVESLFLITAIAGFVELLKRVEARDYYAVAVILGSAIIGGLAGFFHVQEIANVADGITAGLSASGLITVAAKLGQGSTVVANRVTGRNR